MKQKTPLSTTEIIIQKKNENGEEEKKENDVPKTSLGLKKIKILIAVVCGNFFLGCCYGLMAPIFPREAEKKHTSATAYGFVFGIYQLTIFIFSPIFGKTIPILKADFLLKAGMFVSGTCNVLFGLLDYAPAGPSFVALAITIRFCDALGASAFITASFTILATELVGIVGRAVSTTETSFSLGLAVGPVIGSFFYQIGGFRLPFIVIGLILITLSAINLFIFTDNGNEYPKKSVSSLKILLDIDFFIDVIGMNSAYMVLSFNELSLEPHLRQFHLLPVFVGLIFLTSGLTIAVFAVAWGFFAEKVPNAQYLTLIGAFLIIISYLIVGPASFLKFKTILWVVIFSQFLLGLGMSSVIVCSLTHGLKHTLEKGLATEVGVAAGILFSASCLGAFIGPSVGGIIIDHLGYVCATEIAAGFQTVVALICAGRLLYLCFKKNKECARKNDDVYISECSKF